MKRYRYIVLSLVLSILFMSGTSASSPILFDKEIRVGLKELFEMVNAIQITNTSLIIGYDDEGTWETEYQMSSSTGYMITPATGFFLISKQYFDSKEACQEKVDALRGKGHLAYVGNAAPGIWKVFMGDPKTQEEANAIKSNAESVLGLNYEIISDNGRRTFLTYESGTLVLDNGSAQTAFKTNDIVKGVQAINLGRRSYRGIMEVGRYNKKGVTAINVIGLEDYLYGVVPSEIVSSWPKESLKAQAVAARSFAIYNAFTNVKYPKEAYAICDTTTSQVYKGFSGESAACNQAVNETYKQAIYFGDTVIPACFFSSSGGHTEDSQNVWSGTVAYLKGVPDIYETDPSKEPWLKALTAAEIEAILAKNKVNIGNVTDMEVTSYTPSGRALGLKIIGTDGSYELVKETMRVWLGLSSRKFNLVKSTDAPPEGFNLINSAGTKAGKFSGAYVMDQSKKAIPLNMNNEQLIILSKDNINSIPTVVGKSGQYIFVGQGSGHGVGMSQSGAKGMALEGFTYKEILEHYYSGTVVK